MKKVVFLVLSALFFSSCAMESPRSAVGTVSLRIDGAAGSRTILPTVVASSYRIRFTGPAAMDPVNTTSASLTQELSAGTWTIDVEGLNASGSVVASGGESGVVVSSGQTASVSITLNPQLSGTGAIDVTLSWPASILIDDYSVKLDDVSVSASAISFTPGLGGSLRYAGSAASGSHTLVVKLIAASVVKATLTEAVQVYSNLSSAATVALTTGDFSTPAATQIVIDHTSVERYSAIPAAYITAVKKMWLDVPGESHSLGYRLGLARLAANEPTYAAAVTESGTPEAYTDQHLRVSRATWGDRNSSSGWIYGYGEEDWYTTTAVIARTKAHLDHANTSGPAIAAMGFGWCWDMSWQNAPGGTVDPVYGVHWAGSSDGGPQGNVRWGLDSGDQSLTGNSVCMDTYLAATQSYADYCASQGYATKVFFTTGPVDINPSSGISSASNNENAYQRQLKHDHIRAYVASDSSRVLFDYADILAWGNDGTQNVQYWNGHPYQIIHADNMLDIDGSYSEDGDHIGQRGTLRLAKAIWVLLARLAGWEG